MKHARDDYNQRIQDSADLIPEDEPVFLFRAQDALAPAALDEYVRIVETELAECDCRVRDLRRTIARYEKMLANPDVAKEEEEELFATPSPQTIEIHLEAVQDELLLAVKKADNLADVAAKTRAHARLFRQWTTKKIPDC